MTTPYSFHDATVPHFKAGLTALTDIITKGEAYAAEKSTPVDDILEWRLAEDMLPLVFQINMVCDIIMKFVARTHDLTPAEFPFADVKTIADVRARLDETGKWLAKVDVATLDKRADAIVKLQMGPTITKEVSSKAWVEAYGLPNLFFHLTTAYAILRSKGVPLGKRDFIVPWTTPHFTL